jgi:hypothetical protein
MNARQQKLENRWLIFTIAAILLPIVLFCWAAVNICVTRDMQYTTVNHLISAAVIILAAIVTVIDVIAFGAFIGSWLPEKSRDHKTA